MPDVKVPLYSTPELQVEPARQRRGWYRLLPFLAGCVLSYYGMEYWRTHKNATSPGLAVVHHCSSKVSDENPELIWDKLNGQEPEDLSWTKCYQGAFECARLKVPLDYSNPASGYAGIALIKYPAKVSVDHAEYGGPILFNPGGPGGSGVGFIASAGPSFQKLLGQEYDIVGFDPRGIARTTPQAVIFADKAEGIAYRTKIQEDPVFNTTVDAVSRIHSRYSILNEIAATAENGAAQYVSTALVARDMLGITRTFGRDKLQYWGFSYGTVLGATYAAMFPDNIGRLIIDGVVDSHDYYKTSWHNNLLDTDKGFHTFIQACVDAGPEECALYEPTASKVHARIQKLFDTLKAKPVPVLIPDSPYPIPYGLVNYKAAKSIILLFLYAPYTNAALGAPHLAAALHGLENGNGTELWSILNQFIEKLSCECPIPGQPLPPTIYTPDTLQAIACTDGDEVLDSVEDLERYFESLYKVSEFADVWPLRPICVGWKIRSVERFTGPFVANTSHPILVIGNTADPVTPLESAHTMSKGFNGSVVLTQDSVGHCSISGSSPCTVRAIRTYFKEGKLPEPGTVCNTTSRMFGGAQATDYDELVGEDRVLMRAWQQLSDSYEIPRLMPSLQRTML